MKSKIVFSLLASAILAPAAATAADEAWNAPFTLQAGAFQANAKTTVRLDATERNFGTEVSLESDLGMTDSKTTPDIQFLWRINDRHGIEGSWVSLKRSGVRAVAFNINWGDVTFPVNTTVDSEFNSDVYRLTYRYSPINDRQGNELSFLLGIHYTTLDASIHTPTGNIQDSAAIDFPLPTLGIRGSARVAPNWRVTGFGQFLKLKVGDYDGELLNGSAAIEWAFLPQAYVGLGYNYYKYKLISEKSNARGKFDYRFDGPALYFAWAFQ